MKEGPRSQAGLPPGDRRYRLLPWLATLSTLLMAVFAIGAIRTSTIDLPAAVERRLYVAELTGQITHLDEVLTMSAWMVAHTGDPRWRRRYDAHVGRLEGAIRSLRAVSPELFGRELGADTDEANVRLLAMEARAFVLRADGDPVAARAVLDGAAYRADKAAFAAGNERVRTALVEQVANERGITRKLGIDLLLGTIGVATVAALAWVLLFRRTHAQRAAVELRMAQAEREAAEAANHHKSLFVANISHELRTPLTAILGYAELLAPRAGEVDRADTADAAATIVRHGEHLLQVVNDLLDMSKIEAGKVVVDSVATDPASVVDEVISLLHVRASSKGLVLARELTTPVPKRIRTDPGRLRQILVNLVGNAIKFTATGSVRVSVAFEPGEPRGRLSIAVGDTGVGMSEDQLARVFRPFEQGDASTARRFGGTGLGLTIASEFAALLGGRIEVQSERGRGSTFTLTLSVDASDTAELHRPRAAEGAPATRQRASRDALRTMRILLAEDGRDSQRLFAGHLRRAGADVVTVGDGREAVARATAPGESPFDLVLMDMHMPELDGHGATRELRARGYMAPVVALTASAMASDRERCLAAGCDDFLSKPIRGDALVAACARWRKDRSPRA